MLKPTIVDKPAMAVVGLEASFIGSQSSDATAYSVIPQLWHEFRARLTEVRHGLDASALYGVMYFRPEDGRSHPDEVQYIASVPVSSDADIPERMVYYEVPAATFAVFTHHRPLDGIAETIGYIDRVWAPASEYQHSGIEIERYDDRYRGESEDSEMEYWVSVVKKDA